MSTRSGKRIHNSFHENLLKPDAEYVTGSERKTRSRRMKENIEEFNVNILKNKKRVNYVSYPSEDEVGTDTVDSKKDEAKPTPLLRKNALKELNVLTSSLDGVELSTNVKKAIRTTRRTRKFAEDNPENVPVTQDLVEEVNMGEITKLKGKKKIQVDTKQVTGEVVVNKKKNKKKKLKKGRRSGSMIVEDIEPGNGKKNNLNVSIMSVDSFHSAAGSPRHLKDASCDMESPQKNFVVVNTTFESKDVSENLPEKPEGRKTRSTTRKSTANISMNTPNKVVKETLKRKSSTKLELPEDEVEDTDLEPQLTSNSTNKASKRRTSTIKDTFTPEKMVDPNFDKEIKDSTFDLEDLEKRKSIKNSTFDKIETSDKINTTYDKDDNTKDTTKYKADTILDNNLIYDERNTTHANETEVDVSSSITKKQDRKSLINTTYEKSTNNSQIELVKESMTQQSSPVLNTTYEKDSESKQETKATQSSIINTIFDKDNLQPEFTPEILNGNKNLRKSILSISSQKLSTEMNSTFDKTEKSNSTFDKDKKLDATFDKSSKSSLVTLDNSNITLDKSDMSRISITSDDSKDNIANTTPVLVESSMDESQVTFKHSPKSPVQAQLTPLKREGTFTKDEPEVLEDPKWSRTPTKRMSLPSPGFTPFHTTNASREPNVLNVTRSIEKSRRSSLAEPLPRTTKVMFCSPVNNPAVALQQKRKVIKSNLKGSNKSFVFEERELGAARRKRSYTQNDAEDARAKRKRLADGLQHSVDRLSRPRTTSASGKIAESATPKRPTTPSKKAEARVPRTKLPNFAALHQKEFDKMESLDQCQERKAKRARQLLTPTGAITVLDRNSPRENTTEPEKSPNEPPKKDTKDHKDKQPKEAKKPETPVKSLPTFKSLNPGYTRFGFKLNLDVNPFSVPSKSDAKNQSVFSFSSRKDSKAKTSLSFSTKKDKDNSKPLKEIKANLRHTTLPSRAGTTSVRREMAKQVVMREKSFTGKRNVNRNENRTVIKGVRTNRRFELQMKMRNID